MEKKSIVAGTKLDIKLDSMLSEKDFSLKSTYEKKVSDTYFLISAPIKNGGVYFIDPLDKITIECMENNVKYVVEGYVEEYVKKGIRTYLSVHRSTPWHSFVERSDVRMKVNAVMQIEKKYWSSNGEAEIERLDVRTLDISSGGVAIYTNVKLEVGEMVELIFPKTKTLKEFSVRSEACWMRDAERGNSFKHIAGLRFFLTEKREKDMLAKHISAMVQAL